MKSTKDRFENLNARWALLRCMVDEQLGKIVEELTPDCPQRLKEAIHYSLLAPGKRLRPLLVLLAAEAVGSEPQKALAAACAVEMIHCYSLIHDDLPAMDDDDLRRGRPTCHKQFDEGTAILAGDALQAMAFSTLATQLSPNRVGAAVYLLSWAAGPEGMVGGQMDDLWAEKNGGTAELLEAIHRRKTGAMIQVSVQLGALAGGATTQGLDSMRQYGEKIGFAFQIVDDLLDLESSPEAMGKKTGKDAGRGKLTYPGFHGQEASRIRASELIQEAVECVKPFGSSAEPLIDLAHFVLDRSH